MITYKPFTQIEEYYYFKENISEKNEPKRKYHFASMWDRLQELCQTSTRVSLFQCPRALSRKTCMNQHDLTDTVRKK